MVVEGIDKAPPVIEKRGLELRIQLNADGTWTEQVAAGSHNVQVGETERPHRRGPYRCGGQHYPPQRDQSGRGRHP